MQCAVCSVQCAVCSVKYAVHSIVLSVECRAHSKLLGYWDGIPMLTVVGDPNHVKKIMPIMPKLDGVPPLIADPPPLKLHQ